MTIMTERRAREALRALQREGDHEYRAADDILCTFLEELGYEEIVKEYHKIRKWFA